MLRRTKNSWHISTKKLTNYKRHPDQKTTNQTLMLCTTSLREYLRKRHKRIERKRKNWKELRRMHRKRRKKRAKKNEIEYITN